MRIAQIAPIVESVPPKKYGGTERVVHSLTEQLVKIGHDVTLFASGDSQTSANLVSVYPKSLKEANFQDLYGANCYTMLNIGTAYALQDHFDIIHDHTGYMALPAAQTSKTPVVMTYHGPITPEVRLVHQMLNSPFLVSISKSQARPGPDLNWAGTVYNGLEMSRYPFSEADDGYLLFVGRIDAEKGVHHAIKVAQILGLPLIIAAKLDRSPLYLNYYRTKIKPHLNQEIRWVGEVDEKERNKLMSKALAFLHPVTWPEPFGLTMIESMACGTPVVAFNQGSIPEVIQDGRSGFVVGNVEQMVQAVKNIKQIDRRYCRQYALKNFSAKKMAEGYLKIYAQAVEKKKIRDRMRSFVGPVALRNFTREGSLLTPVYPGRSGRASSAYTHDIRRFKTIPAKVKLDLED